MVLAQNSISVLLVDDDEDVRDVISWLLEEAGHRVHRAPGGAEALAFLLEHGPVDVVLSDVNMPDMDGVRLREELKLQWPDIPVLLISGRPAPPGAGAFLAKPFDTSTLLHWLHRIVLTSGMQSAAFA